MNEDSRSLGDPAPIVVRHDLRPGDLGAVVSLHGVVYAAEQGFDATFEAYVAGPLAEFVRTRGPCERLWIAERADRLIGCIAIVGAGSRGALNHAGEGDASASDEGDAAQLRWFLVTPEARGAGLGRRLLGDAVAFARTCGYRSILLWTVSALKTAAALYRAAGFEKVEDKPGRMWGVDVIEEKFELRLDGAAVPATERTSKDP
ncbi:MAG: hypothetical protein FLDDKLPJ_03100 [Phycisphaerae bacterium]|nr:hypothetical protein [Phycisphaerae bacterium]